MAVFIALLRAVNVGGTGKLPMDDLKAMCKRAGFRAVRTYIASGNVVFESEQSESQVKAALEKKLSAYAGKPVGVLVRTSTELAEVLAEPFFEGAAKSSGGDLSRSAATGRRVEGRFGKEGRRTPARKERNLRPLRRGNGYIEAEDSRRQERHRAQHEYGGEARSDGK